MGLDPGEHREWGLHTQRYMLTETPGGTVQIVPQVSTHTHLCFAGPEGSLELLGLAGTAGSRGLAHSFRLQLLV